MTTNSKQDQQPVEQASRSGNFTAWGRKVSEVSRSLNFRACESVFVGLMERQRNQMRGLQERIWGCKWNSGTSSDSVIWVLGVCYHVAVQGEDETVATQNVTQFLLDFSSRVWLTYRRGFEAVSQTTYTTDVGWGCMLRSGQMLLAQALVCHHLGRDWRRVADQPIDQRYLKILQSFGDSRAETCPFSIHNLLEAGCHYGLVAGSWLGPYALCRTIEALALSYRERSHAKGYKSMLPMAVCVVSGDADGERGGAPVLCVEDVANLCKGWEDPSSEWAPLLLLVPLVLGLDKINPRYLPLLSATFCFPQSLGIAGGKPGASTYLIGVQDDQAVYLDPHEVQQAVTVSPNDLETDTSSYHCTSVRRMSLDAIDPSLALGFYCANREEFGDLCNRASELANHSNGAPIFTVAESRRNQGSNSLSFAKLSLDVEESSLKMKSLDEEDWQIL